MTRSRTVSRGRQPAPYLGVDFRIPITDMPPEYSPFMINFLCENGRIRKRPGHDDLGSFSGGLNFVIPGRDSSGDAQDIVINPTTTAVIGVGTVASPSSLGYRADYTIWQDKILIAGYNSVQELDPTVPSYTTRLSFTPSTTTTQRRGICSYRQRLYVAEGKKLHYSPSVGAISGTADTFDLQYDPFS